MKFISEGIEEAQQEQETFVILESNEPAKVFYSASDIAKHTTEFQKIFLDAQMVAGEKTILGVVVFLNKPDRKGAFVSMSIDEARQIYSEDEMSDEDLQTLISEIDTVQSQILDDIFFPKKQLAMSDTTA